MTLHLRDDLFDHAEAVLVHGELDEVRGNGLKDEVDVFLAHAKEDALENVGAVGVVGQLDDVALYSFFELLLLGWHVDHLYQALHTVRAVFVASDLRNMRLQNIEDLVTLSRAGALKKSLAEVVPVLISHQMMNMVKTFLNGETNELWAGLGKKLLKLLAPKLILCHLNNLSTEVIVLP